jgi:regulator of sigma E protease
MIVSIVAAVAIFAIIVIVHEAGHFAVAKRLGVRVLRFSVGYPPRIWGIRRGETDYAIGATPLGGYVRMLGDEVADEPAPDAIRSYLDELRLDLMEAVRTTDRVQVADATKVISAIADEFAAARSGPAVQIENGTAARLIGDFQDEPKLASIGRAPTTGEAILLREVARSGETSLAIDRLAEQRPSSLLEEFKRRAFPSQPLSHRIAIVLAGPLANILFAPLLTIVTLMIGMPIALAVVGAVDQGMPAYNAGLRSGDHVVAIDGKTVDSWDDFSRVVKASGGHELHLRVERGKGSDAQTLDIAVRPKQASIPTIYGDKEPTWIIGVSQSGAEGVRRLPIWRAIPKGIVDTGQMAATLCVGIAKIVDGATPVREALGGPIMIARIAGKEVHRGFAEVAMFMVMISLELGIINLLPIPMLDGGHLLFFTIEGIKGSPLKLRHREIAMQVGLFLLAILMAFVIFNDISHLIG